MQGYICQRQLRLALTILAPQNVYPVWFAFKHKKKTNVSGSFSLSLFSLPFSLFSVVFIVTYSCYARVCLLPPL
jgi:hypothetical protein